MSKTTVWRSADAEHYEEVSTEYYVEYLSDDMNVSEEWRIAPIKRMFSASPAIHAAQDLDGSPAPHDEEYTVVATRVVRWRQT